MTMFGAHGRLNTYVFIDAGRVRAAFDAVGNDWTELSLATLAGRAIESIAGNWPPAPPGIGRTFAYDACSGAAAPPGASASEASPKVAEWLERNDQIAGLHVRTGHLAGGTKRRTEQKAVDVRLAVDALSFAVAGLYDLALIVAGDADFIPLVDAIRSRGPLVAVSCFPGQGYSKDLRREADLVGYLTEPGRWRVDPNELPPLRVD